jgi:hypothetical protein
MTDTDDERTGRSDGERPDGDATARSNTDDATESLTRRDAMAALTAAGASTALGGTLSWGVLTRDPDGGGDPQGFDERQRATLVALAEHLYPSAVSGIPEFVETYTVGRVRDRPEYAAGMREALDTLDEYAVQWAGDRFADLSPDRWGALLSSMGVPEATPEPEGLDPERVRFYLVNELLFALYTTPTGGELVGIENPQGYPGGTTSYRQGPRR